MQAAMVRNREQFISSCKKAGLTLPDKYVNHPVDDMDIRVLNDAKKPYQISEPEIGEDDYYFNYFIRKISSHPYTFINAAETDVELNAIIWLVNLPVNSKIMSYKASESKKVKISPSETLIAYQKFSDINIKQGINFNLEPSYFESMFLGALTTEELKKLLNDRESAPPREAFESFSLTLDTIRDKIGLCIALFVNNSTMIVYRWDDQNGEFTLLQP